MNLNLFDTVLIILTLTVITSLIFRYIRLPVVLGYLIIGAIAGPHGLKWLTDIADIRKLAEFGIVFLMFMVGLEFSLNRLYALRHSVFVLGLIQVVITITVCTLIGLVFHIEFIESLIIGGIIAMSSTAIVLKQLDNQFELNTPHGTKSVGILLFQDIAVVPFFILITSLSVKSVGIPISASLLSVAIKSVIVITIMISLGRWALKPLFRLITGTKVQELFTLTALLITLSSAWLTHYMGLSLALGAFIGGVLLGESQFKHQIKIEVRPFRDIFLGLFFISIGMLLATGHWNETWPWILITLIGLTFGKAFLITVLVRLFKTDWATSFRTGIILGQGGEFGFAILTLAYNQKLLPQPYVQVILAALVLSIAIAPIIIQFNESITKWFFKKPVLAQKKHASDIINNIAARIKQPIIICGYGRVGQNIARFIRREKFPYIALDIDSLIIHNAALAGEPVFFGDATHPDILAAMHLEKARAVVLTLADGKSSLQVLEEIRASNKTIPIIVRTKDDIDSASLEAAGATRVVTEAFEESLTMAYYLLREINIPETRAAHLVDRVRHKQYDLLRQVFRGEIDEEEAMAKSRDEGSSLHLIQIPEEADAVDKTVSELNLSEINVELISIRHPGEHTFTPHADTRIRSNDILIVYGANEAAAKAEKVLLKGK